MPPVDRCKLGLVAVLMVAALTCPRAPANAEPLPLFAPAHSSFTATLSNNTPLAFGMAAEDAARALGTPLNYISGRPGDEIFMVFRNVGGSGFFDRHDKLYLQFRRGRLAGWKGDWGRRWIWQ